MAHDQRNISGDAGLAARLSVRILATTDLHAHLLPWDYFTFTPAFARGLAPLASLIDAARAETANCMLFDNGDFLNGSGLGDHLAQIYPSGLVHPMIAAMNALRYDAVNLGNHEFSHGLPHLVHALKDAEFPIISSNYDFSDLPVVQPSALFTRDFTDDQGQVHAVRLGVIGLLPNQAMVWEATHLQGRATARPLLDSAAFAAQRLRQQGADIVIALAHTGLARDLVVKNEENCAETVLHTHGIDAVIAGHSHLAYPSETDDPAHLALVQPGFFGSHLGVLDIDLVKIAEGWRKVAHHAAIRPISRRRRESGRLEPLVPASPAIAALAAPSHAEILVRSERQIGILPQRLHSYFTTIAPSALLALIAAAQRRALIDRLLGTPFETLPVLSAVAPFKSGGRGGPENYTDLMPGPLRHYSVSDLYIHPNTFVGFRLTGAELRLWLERSASKYAQVLQGGDDGFIHNPAFPSFNCDSIFGLTYQIDLGQPAMYDYQGRVINPDARRVVNMRFGGQEVRADQVFALASNSYRLGGNMGFPATTQDHVIYQSTDLIQNILHHYIAAGHPIPPADPAHWSFVPLPGRSARLKTSPKAAEVLDEIAHFRPQNLGLDDEGFLTFRLHL